MYSKYIKRSMDLILAIIAFLIFLIPILLISFFIKLTSPGPVFFKQERIGKNKKHFMIYKFRSMRVDAPKDAPTHLLKDAKSFITPIGAILRKTSLDELPQLINIIHGDMAIVGPRPALWNQSDLIDLREHFGVNDVHPGLTGLAQISGRDELDIETKAELDAKYIRQISCKEDLKIIFATVLSVFKSEGIVDGEKNG